MTSSSVGPCFFFRRSSSASRSSTSCSRAGEASMPAAYDRRKNARSSSCDLTTSRASRYGANRASSAASSPSRFQTIAERRKRRLLAFVECVVRLGAEALQPVGVGQHLARRRELLVLARLRRDADRSPPAGRSGTRRATPSRARWRAAVRARRRTSLPCRERVGDGTRVRRRGRRTRRADRDAWPDRAGPGARAGRADRRGRRDSSRSAALVASAPSTNARLRPCAEISRRTITSPAVRLSRRWPRRSPCPRRSGRGRRTRGRRRAGRRRRRGWTCRRRFRRSGR